VWRPVYIRPSLQLSLTLACIKALSKTLPNIHRASHVLAPPGAFADVVDRNLVRSPRLDWGSDLVRGQSKWSLKTSKSHFVVKWRNHPNFLISASFLRSRSWHLSFISRFCKMKCIYDVFIFADVFNLHRESMSLFLTLRYSTFLQLLETFALYIFESPLGFEPCWHLNFQMLLPYIELFGFRRLTRRSICHLWNNFC